MNHDKDEERYEELLYLPHPTSSRHPRMSVSDRAAQFAPFSALTGYGDAIDETARLTDQRVELSEEMKEILDMKQRFLSELLDKKPKIRVTYFISDRKKGGGAYKTADGRLCSIDTVEQQLCLADGTRIPMGDVADIESELFGGLFDDR